MIIHIGGPSGSGKTTLGRRLSKLKNTVVIDTDNIDDPNRLKIAKFMDIFNKKFDKEVAKLNKNDMKKILKIYNKKTIILVGFLHDGLDVKVDEGFCIKIDVPTLFRQYNLRTLDALTKYKREITQLLNSGQPQGVIHFILFYKFGIRNGFDCSGPADIKEMLDKQVKKCKKYNYQYATSDEIYRSISMLL